MIPNGQGGMAWVQYDYQDQNRNWSGTSEAPAADNGDKEIETHFVTLGVQYMFNDQWGAQTGIAFRITASSRRILIFRRRRPTSCRAIWSQLGRHPRRGNLHRIFRGFVGGRDVRPEIADGQLQRRPGGGGSRHANRHRQHGRFARRILSRHNLIGRPKMGLASRNCNWMCRC